MACANRACEEKPYADLCRDPFLHEYAEWVIPILTKRTAAFKAASGVQAKCFRLTWASFKPQQFAIRGGGLGLEHRKHGLCNAFPSAARVDVHGEKNGLCGAPHTCFWI